MTLGLGGSAGDAHHEGQVAHQAVVGPEHDRSEDARRPGLVEVGRDLRLGGGAQARDAAEEGSLGHATTFGAGRPADAIERDRRAGRRTGTGPNRPSPGALRTRGASAGRQRQPEPGRRPAARRAQQADLPAMRLDQVLRDRQAEPGAAGVGRPGEPVEDAVGDLGRQARAPVADLDPGRVRIPSPASAPIVDRALRAGCSGARSRRGSRGPRGSGSGRRRRAAGRRPSRSGTSSVDRRPARLGDRRERAGDVGDEQRRGRSARGGAAACPASDRATVRRSSISRPSTRVSSRIAARCVGVGRVDAVDERLDVALDHRQRGAQLVADVGQQRAALALVGLEPGGHRVEAAGQLEQLGRPAIRLLDPDRVVAGLDPARRVGQLGDRLAQPAGRGARSRPPRARRAPTPADAEEHDERTAADRIRPEEPEDRGDHPGEHGRRERDHEHEPDDDRDDPAEDPARPRARSVGPTAGGRRPTAAASAAAVGPAAPAPALVTLPAEVALLPAPVVAPLPRAGRPRVGERPVGVGRRRPGTGPAGGPPSVTRAARRRTGSRPRRRSARSAARAGRARACGAGS